MTKPMEPQEPKSSLIPNRIYWKFLPKFQKNHNVKSFIYFQIWILLFCQIPYGFKLSDTVMVFLKVIFE